MFSSITVLAFITFCAQVSAKPLSSSTDAQKALVNFMKDGINYKTSPCDDFYDFVCSANRSSHSSDVQRSDEFSLSLTKSIRADKEYPDISKSLLSHIEECLQFQNNETYMFNSIHKYLKSFGFFPFLSESPTKQKVHFFQALLRLIFLSPSIYPFPGVFSPIEIEYEFYSENNTLELFANPGFSFIQLPIEDQKAKTFTGYFDRAWALYQKLTLKYEHFPGYVNTARELEKMVTFVNDYLSITAKSGKELMSTKTLHNLDNNYLRKAIIEILPHQLHETVNMGNLNVSLDEQLFDELFALFQSRPNEGQHFILSMALLTLSYSIEMPMLNENITISSTTLYCSTSYALNPRKSGAIFNLYAADLVIRNKYSGTLVSDQLNVRYLVEKIQFIINSVFIDTSFLKNSRELITALDLLFRIKTTVGFPDDVYESNNYKFELAQFSGFYPEDDFIDQIIKLRSSNNRLRRRLLSSEASYFNFYSYFNLKENSLNVAFLSLQAPIYDRSYPDSYNIGSLGSTIGHELFHRFAPPFHQERWLQKTQFNESLDCYKKFYSENMCYDIVLKKNETEYHICAGDFKNPYQENIPDVEGARVAYRALTEIYGSKLKNIAMPELFNFTHEQLFFISGAQKWCDKAMNDHLKFASALIDKDPHGVDKVRVNAVAMQMKEFAIAFNCKATDSMVVDEHQRCYMLPSN